MIMLDKNSRSDQSYCNSSWGEWMNEQDFINLGTTNVCIKFHVNPSNNCWHICTTWQIDIPKTMQLDRQLDRQFDLWLPLFTSCRSDPVFLEDRWETEVYLKLILAGLCENGLWMRKRNTWRRCVWTEGFQEDGKMSDITWALFILWHGGQKWCSQSQSSSVSPLILGRKLKTKGFKFLFFLKKQLECCIFYG